MFKFILGIIGAICGGVAGLLFAAVGTPYHGGGSGLAVLPIIGCIAGFILGFKMGAALDGPRRPNRLQLTGATRKFQEAYDLHYKRGQVVRIPVQSVGAKPDLDSDLS